MTTICRRIYLQILDDPVLLNEDEVDVGDIIALGGYVLLYLFIHS